jgi:hypothetical protein
MGESSDRVSSEKGRDASSGDRPLLTPAQLAERYGLGLTKVYEECRYGVLKDECVRWGRRILIPAQAARRMFEGEDRP